MDWLRTVWVNNTAVVLVFYGQIFFTLGVALAVYSLKQTRLHLGRHLRWLAAFGLTHGLVEWGYIFIPLHGMAFPGTPIETLRWVQLGLMGLSFVFLFRFGLNAAVRSGPLGRPLPGWLLMGALVALALGVGLFSESDPQQARVGTEVWLRYLLAVPGSALGALGVHAAAREVDKKWGARRISGWLELSAGSLGAYALLNITTPEHHWLLSRWLNYDTVVSYVGIPVQVWRTLVGAGMLVGMLRSLPVFEVEREAARNEWIGQVLAAQEDDRRHIAHELHDEAIHSLVVVCRRLDTVRDAVRQLCGAAEPAVLAEVAAARQEVEGLSAALRRFAYDLRPPALDELGAVACIRRLVKDVGRRTALRLDFRVHGAERRLDRDLELGLFRIAQEAIRNVERHAQARSAWVDLTFGDGHFRLEVRDYGRGLPQHPYRPERPDRLGLLGMQERANLLGGSLEVDSEPQRGTRLTLSLPVRPGSRSDAGAGTKPDLQGGDAR